MTAWTVLATCGPAALVSLFWFQRICVDYVESGRHDTEQAWFDDQFARIVTALEQQP
ncbi:hypothetical protein ACFVGN_43230 [Streptomyces sp. NPDC057757]|uniref:hypothetical protein n=1 Tax=Streptomyces sp. NPDC057757 TaxID=3346241 RepID=UPI0036A977CD